MTMRCTVLYSYDCPNKAYIMNFFTKLTAVLVVAAVQAKANSYYSIAYYSDSDCRNLLGSSSGSFTKNGCLSGGNLSGVNSIWISTLSNAKIHTWVSPIFFEFFRVSDSILTLCISGSWELQSQRVGRSCDMQHGASTSGVCISAPGTNSIGYQVGCD
jgi:hypothetical protein